MFVPKHWRCCLPLLSRMLLLCAVLGLCGCGGKATVTGVVTYKGTPLPSGTVTFYGEKKEVVSGPIGTDGRYTVSKVPFGTVKITVSTPTVLKDTKKLPPAKDVVKVPPVKVVPIPPKYSDPAKSGLTCTVTSNPQEHPIDLK